MKFSTAIAVSGATVASANAVREAAPTEYCDVEIKTIGLSWIALDQFPVAESWSYDEALSNVGDSTYDPSQVYSELNYTITTTSISAPYPTGGLNGTFSALTSTKTSAPVAGQTSTRVTSAPSATATSGSGSCTNPRVRVEWRNLSDGQRDSFVSAVKCLIEKPSSNSNTFPGSRNLFEDLTSLHQQLVNSVHGFGTFIVWHRYFVSTFESLLRSECGYTAPLPWWNEALDSGDFANAPMFTSRWLGALQAGIDGRGVCVTESGFGAYEANLGPGGAINNPHCLSRSVDESLTQNTNQQWVDNCNNAQNYDAFRSCCELTYHAYGHNGIGSVMANVAASPEDPVFYLHHGFIDRNYRVWQKGSSSRNFEIGGASPSGGTVQPSYVLTSYGLVPQVTVADVLDTEGDYLCYVYDDE